MRKDILGVLKFMQNRLQSYIGVINFVMLFYLYIIESPLGLQWYFWLLAISVISITILVVDRKYVLPGVLTYGFKVNPMMMEMKKEIEEIKEMLERQTK